MPISRLHPTIWRTILPLIHTRASLPPVGALIRLKVQHQEDPDCMALVAHQAALLRSLLTVGTLCRHFDFDQDHFKGAHNKVHTQVKARVGCLFISLCD